MRESKQKKKEERDQGSNAIENKAFLNIQSQHHDSSLA